VYACGGSAEYLIGRVNRTGFRRDLLRFIRGGGIYVGVSAGSYIAANNVKNGLGLLDVTMRVHCAARAVRSPADDAERIIARTTIVVLRYPDFDT
jgi:hypothetical protein